jgi:hypothetical protein
MKKLALKLLSQWLGLSYQKPEVFVVTERSGIDSVWFSRHNAQKHVDEMTTKAKVEGVDFGFRIASPKDCGNYILDAQDGLYRLPAKDTRGPVQVKPKKEEKV